MAVTGTIGDAEVRLENAAEEATMKKILEAIQDQRGSGGTSPTSTNSPLATLTNLGKSANLAGLAFKGLGMAIGSAAGALKGLTGIGASAVSLGTSFVAAQPKITDFTAALGDLPWILGDFGKAIDAVTKLLYNNLTVYRQLTTSGIAFGDRLEQMTGYGANVGTSLNHLAGLLTENANSFAFLGTATRGASMAIRANEEAFDANSRMLQTFGLSFEEQSEQFMRFFSLNSLGLARGTMTQDQLTDMSGQYIKQMRRLSELTGKQADELQAGIDRANMNRAFQNELAKMPADVRNRFGLIMNTVQEGFGDAGREAMMATMLGIAPVTDEAATMMSINRDFGTLLNNLNTSARGFTGNIDAFGTMMYEQMRGFANTNRGYADGYSRFASALTMTNDPVGMAQSQLIYGINLFSGRIDEVSSNLGKESPLQKAFNELEGIIQTLRKTLSDTLVTILSDPTFQKALTDFSLWIQQINDDIQAEGFIPYITRKFEELLDNMYILMANSKLIRFLFLDDEKIAAATANRIEAQLAENPQANINREDLNTVMEGTRQIFGENRQGAVDIMNQYLRPDSEFRKAPIHKMLDSMFGYDPNRQLSGSQVYSNLINRFQTPDDMFAGFDNAQLEEMFGPNYEQQIIDLFQALQQYRSQLDQNAGMYSGTFGRYGRVLNDFGRGTLATLHGREAVLNESQLANLVSGAMTQGAMSVPENLPNTGNFSKDLGNMTKQMVDSNRDNSVKLIEAVNMLARKMDQQNTLTRQVIETVQYG